jgi:hypothetical protein
MTIVQNYSFNSSLDSRQKVFTNDQMYFPLRFIQLLRLMCTYIAKYSFSTNIIGQNFKPDFKVHWIHILQINLLQQLLRFSTQFYRIGLRFLFKENPSSSVTFSEKEFFLPQTNKGVSISQTKSIIDVSEMGYQPLQQNGDENVPEWTISAKCNSFSDQNTSVNLTPKSNFFSLRTSVLKATATPKLGVKANFTKNYRSDKSHTDSSSFAIITSRPKSKFKKNGPKKNRINDTGFQFFYQNQGLTRPQGIELKTFFLHPSWKLSLNSLEHTENQKNDLFTNPSLHFNLPHYEKCVQAFEAQNFINPYFNHHTQNELSVVTEKMKTKHEDCGYLHERKIKKQIKSPVVAYNYKTERNLSSFSLKKISLSPDNVEFNCLLEAVSRNWIFTIQKNPFGKITLLIY